MHHLFELFNFEDSLQNYCLSIWDMFANLILEFTHHICLLKTSCKTSAAAIYHEFR